ncbi:MAG: RHS repeat protein [Oscillatoria sp. SIO1A7]|nr:RHS repeat protein [Oscillatoria sp. SIO1A7]
MGIQNPFADGTRVYVTLPGGKRTGFTFRPRGDRLNSFLGSFAGGAASWFHPAFVADDGSDVTLSVPDVRLIKGANTDEYYDLSGTPYNPENPRFGSRYTLTTKEGIVYEIDAVSGDLVAATDRNGNKLTFSDAGILSDTGKQVTFERDAAGRIAAILDPEGNKIRYSYDSKGDLVAVTDREDNTTELKYEIPERAHYLNEIIDPLGRTGVRSEYDESGRLSRMLDVNGEAVQLSYDPENSIQRTFDVFGNPTTYIYDDRGNVVSELDPVGLVTNRTYDDNNNVLTETIVTDESGPDGWTTTYTYDANGNQLSQTDPLGNVSRSTYNRFGQVLTETDPLGNTTNYTYSPSGNLLSDRDAEGNVTKYSYDLRGNLLSATDANNQTTQFSYDQSGNVLAVVDPLGNETTYTYNSRGDQLTETRKVTTPNGLEEITTKSEYDSKGRLKSVTDAQNQTTEYLYDANDNQIAVIDALGRRTETRYDEKGQLVETVYPDSTPNNPNDNLRTISVYDKGGRQRATVDEAGRVTHYTYDAAGRQTEIIYPDGTDTFEQFLQAVGAFRETPLPETVDWTEVVYPEEAPAFLADNPRTITEYSKNGETKADIDERGNRTEYRYNALGQLLETIYPDDTPANIADNPRTTSQYDASGRQIISIDALNRTTEFVYDELGRVAETLFPDGTTTKTIYDAVGRQVASIDQAGNKTEYEYDALGRLTDVMQFLDPSGENKEIRTEYGYDELGRLIWQEDANDHRTNYEYDKSDRRTAVILPEGQRSETTYNAVGNVNTEKDFNGEITVYRYDEQNRLTSIDLPDDPDITFTYTPTGQRETVTDGRGTTSYVYDERERLTSRTDPTGPYISSGATIEYEYDAAGNRTFMRTPGGFTSYEFDERNRLEKVNDSSQGVTTYKYDAVSNLVETVLPNGVVETREYDEQGRLEYLENELGGTVISSYDYEKDPVGNRLSVTEHDGRKVEYEYDSLYRLVSENIADPNDPANNGRTITYSYDNVGNRLSRNDSVEGQTTYQYNGNDWLLEERYGNGDVVVYEYDNNGNTIKRVKNGTEETVYVWDDRDRLAEVRTPDGDVITYTYDVDNIRVSETVNGVTTQYIVDKNRNYAQVLEEYIDGQLQVRYVYGLDLISQERDGQVSVYLADGLGSTRVLTDAGGQVQNTYTYDAFGNLISSSGSVENKYQFAGEQLDENLGQYYLRQRYYDAGIGRFTRRDTYGGRSGEPITLHKYLYANANPVNGIDPTGLFKEDTSAALVMQRILSSTSQVITTTARVAFAGFVGLPLAVVRILARLHAIWQMFPPNVDRWGVPIVVWGGNDMPETTDHVFKALTLSGYTRNNPQGNLLGSRFITPLLSRAPAHRRGWYNREVQCQGRTGAAGGNPRRVCDEYPYATAAQGGRQNYNEGLVSIHPVLETEQTITLDGTQGTRLAELYRRANITNGNVGDINSWFVTFAYPWNRTFWVDRQGVRQDFNR